MYKLLSILFLFNPIFIYAAAVQYSRNILPLKKKVSFVDSKKENAVELIETLGQKKAELVRKRFVKKNTRALIRALKNNDTSAIKEYMKNPDDIDFGPANRGGDIVFDYALRHYATSRPVVGTYTVQYAENSDLVYSIYQHSKQCITEQDSAQRFLAILSTEHTAVAHDLLDTTKADNVKMFSGVDSKKRNAVHYAVTYGQGDILRALHTKKAGCEWNQQDQDGRTPFMLACQLASSAAEKSKCLPLAWYLLHTDRVDVTRKDNSGMSTHDYSKMSQNDRLAKFVVAKMEVKLADLQQQLSSVQSPQNVKRSYDLRSTSVMKQ